MVSPREMDEARARDMVVTSFLFAHSSRKQYAGGVFFCECSEMISLLVMERSLGFARDDKRMYGIYLIENRERSIISV